MKRYLKNLMTGGLLCCVVALLLVFAASAQAEHEISTSDVQTNGVPTDGTIVAWTGNVEIQWEKPDLSGAGDTLMGFDYKWNTSALAWDGISPDGTVDPSLDPPIVTKAAAFFANDDSTTLRYLHVKTKYLDISAGGDVSWSSDVKIGPINIDNVAPTGTVQITDSEGIVITSTKNTALNLKLLAAIAPVKMYLSETSTRPLTGVTYANGVVYELANTAPGSKTIYAWFEDSVGNISKAPATATVTLLAPISINPDTATIDLNDGTQVFILQGTEATDYIWSIVDASEDGVAEISGTTTGNSVTVNLLKAGTFKVQAVKGADTIKSGTITIIEAIDQYTLTYIAGNNGTITGSVLQLIDQGRDGTEVTATPDVGYHFVAWSDGVTSATRRDTNITGDMTVMANFAINQYTVSYATEDNGFVYGPESKIVNYGESGGAAIAVPNEGYHFVQWSDGVTDNPRTSEKVTSNTAVTAVFAINEYTISYIASEGGSISGTAIQVVEHGADGTAVEAVPDPKYHFVKWSDGKLENPRTDTNVIADIAVQATFAMPILSGKVVLSQEGYPNFPVPGAHVDLTSNGPSDAYSTVTGDNGWFILAGIPGGNYVLTVTSSGLTTITQNVTLEENISLDLGVLPAMNFQAMFTQEQLDQAVSDANAAKDLIIAEKEQVIASMFTQAQLDQAVADAEAAKDGIIASMFTEEQLNQTVEGAVAEVEAAKDEIIASMFTQEQLDQALIDAVAEWDVDADGKIGILEIIYHLQLLSGMRE